MASLMWRLSDGVGHRIPLVKRRNLRGVLEKYKNELLVAEEKDAWPRVVEENHENS